MGKCVVKYCRSRSQNHKKANGITFHTVPRDPERRFKWMEIIRLLRKETDWIPTKSSIICSKHFREEDKIYSENAKGRIYLSDEAIPQLEVPNSKHTQFPSLEDINEDVEIVSNVVIEEITDTPKECKMRIEIDRLNLVSTRRLKKIRSLYQKNRSLVANNKKLQDLVEELKQKRPRSKTKK